MQPQQPDFQRALCLCWELETFSWFPGDSVLIPGSTADSQGLTVSSVLVLASCPATSCFHLPAAVLAQIMLCAGYQSCACGGEMCRAECSALSHFVLGMGLLYPGLLATPAIQHSKKCWEQFSNVQILYPLLSTPCPLSSCIFCHYFFFAISTYRQQLSCISVLLSQQWCILYDRWMQSRGISWMHKLTVMCLSGPWQGVDMNS